MTGFLMKVSSLHVGCPTLPLDLFMVSKLNHLTKVIHRLNKKVFIMFSPPQWISLRKHVASTHMLVVTP